MIKLNEIMNMIVFILSSIATLYIFIVYSVYLNIIMKISILVLYLLFVFALYKKRKDLLIIIYFVFLFVVLFVRDKVDTNISGNNYLEKWVNLIFKNKIVFVNLIGNIFLYMPFSWCVISLVNKNGKIIRELKSLVSIIICLLIILSLEVLQMLTLRGVFDYVDILLNMIGVLIIVIIFDLIEGFRYGKTKKG